MTQKQKRVWPVILVLYVLMIPVFGAIFCLHVYWFARVLPRLADWMGM